MTRFANLMTAAAAIGGLATPALAQTSYQYGYPNQGSTYPNQGYGYQQPQQYGYGQQGSNNPIGQIIDQLLSVAADRA